MQGSFACSCALMASIVNKRRVCREQLKQELSVANAANGEFKKSIEQGHGDDDFAAVYGTISK